MIYKNLNGVELSALGLGCMRLPQKSENGADIDEVALGEMVDYAISKGVNYFDTAWVYHQGKSEEFVGRALAKYPRESFYIATKFPGFSADFWGRGKEIFEEQLRRLGMDYIDYYLIHNVSEHNVEQYMDTEKYGDVEYMISEKKAGRIKHLGFSTHGTLATMKKFLDKYATEMEFCQIQLNYLDYKLQSAKEKIELIRSYGLGVWVMEPVRGGRLAALEPAYAEKLEALRPGVSAPEWAFRFLQTIPDVVVTLSGMSNMQQLRENIATFESEKVLNETEWQAVMEIADDMIAKKTLPCTECRYCTPYCAQGLNIPQMIKYYNAQMYPENAGKVRAEIGALPEEQKPTACIGCQACESVCPQNIKISEMMAEMAKRYC